MNILKSFSIGIAIVLIFSTYIISKKKINQHDANNHYNHSTFSSGIDKKLNRVLEQAFIDQQMIGVIVGIWVPGQGK